MANDQWSDAELRAAVDAYVWLQNEYRAGRKPVKTAVYRTLAAQFGRNEKAYDYRLRNISHVLAVQGLSWVPGLPPARNVGRRVAEIIERFLAEAQQRPVNPDVGFEVEVVDAVQAKALPRPTGHTAPATRIGQAAQISRDPRVKAWVLQQANGVCEQCGQPGPFALEDGTRFLEVHHVRPLQERGSDTVENTVAVCPNCHRALHFAKDRREMVEGLYARVRRLRRE